MIFKLPIANQPTVLVVDDQQPTLRMYQRYLSRSNFKVVGIDNPHQVFPLLEQFKPDLILLDVMMPQIDGWEILQALQLDEELHQIPVIVCSAWESADLAKSLGATEFLKKPITQERLLTAIKTLDI
jgi:CheY-like chemotaxis protein